MCVSVSLCLCRSEGIAAHSHTHTHTHRLHYITIGFVSGLRLNNKEYKNTWTSFHFDFLTVLFFFSYFCFSYFQFLFFFLFVIRQQQQRAVAGGMWQRQDLIWITLSTIYTLHIYIYIYNLYNRCGTQSEARCAAEQKTESRRIGDKTK